MPLEVTLAEILKAAHRSNSEHVHTALPAKVESFNPLTNTVNVTVQVKRPVHGEDGDVIGYDDFPVIPDVPVLFPQGGGFVITFPLASGDFVWLQFAEASIGEWRLSGQVSEPVDTRRHSSGYPVAIPGVRPDVDPMSAVPTDLADRITKMVLGKDGGPSVITIGSTDVKVGSPSASVVSPVALSVPLAANLTPINSELTSIAALLAMMVTEPTMAAFLAGLGGGAAAIAAVAATDSTRSGTVAGLATVPSTVLKSL